MLFPHFTVHPLQGPLTSFPVCAFSSPLQVVLPQGWRCPLSEAGDWVLTEQGERAYSGATQITTMVEFDSSGAVESVTFVGLWLGLAGESF